MYADPAIVKRDRQARHAWVLGLGEMFLRPAGLSLRDLPPPCFDEAAKAWLAGFCSICDWVASNEEVSPFQAPQPEVPLREYFDRRTKAIRDGDWLSRLGLKGAPQDFAGVGALLAEAEAPRGVQVLVPDLPAKPSLVLIEAPTGSGKTAAALAHAWRLLAAGWAEGIVFALPTQATANAMFERIARFAARAFGAASVVLARGRSEHHEGFRRLQQAGGNEGYASAGLQCTQWLAQSRKRAFLGQTGVCTIDQALLSVLPVRHKFVRGFALARSALIVDEVDAYDAYMHGLLAELLRRQKAVGGSAILLSATLPASVAMFLPGGITSKLPKLLQLYHRGCLSVGICASVARNDL